MILADRDILLNMNLRDQGDVDTKIRITPFDPHGLQPASVDFKLASTFKSFISAFSNSGPRIIDPSKDASEHMVTVTTDEYILYPGGFVLGSTIERVSLENGIVANVEGKSSLGRLGLTVHATAGLVDPGFDGCITLEMFNMSPLPIRLRAGMWICQLVFQYTKSLSNTTYQGRYRDQLEPRPVASRAHL